MRRPEAVAELRELAPDLVLLADYGQLIPRVLLDLPPRGFLNLHPSALPRWRGAAPIPATILAGDTETAVTLMLVTEEMDAGPIVAAEPLEVRPDDTAVTLEERAAGAAAVLLRRALPDVARREAGGAAAAGRGHHFDAAAPPRGWRGSIPADPLPSSSGRFAHTSPGPGSYLDTREGRLIVWRAHVAASEPADEAGRLVPCGREGLAVAAAADRLVLDEVQLAGRKKVAAAELRRGYPGLVGRLVV